MRPGKPAPWYIRTGDDFEYFFQLRDKNTQAVQSMDGWTGSCEMKAAKGSADPPLATFVVTCSAQGCLITLADTVTELLTPTTGGSPGVPDPSWPWVDVQLVDLAGFTRTWVETQVEIDSDVTD